MQNTEEKKPASTTMDRPMYPDFFKRSPSGCSTPQFSFTQVMKGKVIKTVDDAIQTWMPSQ